MSDSDSAVRDTTVRAIIRTNDATKIETRLPEDTRIVWTPDMRGRPARVFHFSYYDDGAAVFIEAKSMRLPPDTCERLDRR